MKTPQTADTGKHPSSPRPGEFFLMVPDPEGPVHRISFENGRELRQPGRGMIRPLQGGFPPLTEVPRLRITDETYVPRDLESTFEGYWLVSERLKVAFERFAPGDFEFVRCEFMRFDGSAAEPRYLCEVAKEVDAIDDEASRIEILTDGYHKGKFYDLVGGASIAFISARVDGTHVFRSPYNRHLIACDRAFRDSMVDQGYGSVPDTRGIWFVDASGC